MSTPTKSRRRAKELCPTPSGNVESENTLSLDSVGGTIYPVLPQALATGSLIAWDLLLALEALQP